MLPYHESFLICRHHACAMDYAKETFEKHCFAASLWISIKFIAPRTALPSASFISHVTGKI